MIMIDRLAMTLAVWSIASAVWGADWITQPSYFTHDQAGKRVQQYTPIGPFYIFPNPSYQRSGYQHTRSSLQVGSSADHYHVVEEWGRQVRPYDEWRFPYRPYSVPYELWGPPYAGLRYGFGRGYYGFPGLGGRPGGVPIPPDEFEDVQRPNLPYHGFRPWFDDRYPAFDDRAPFRRAESPEP
jgi:hypothetical protein